MKEAEMQPKPWCRGGFIGRTMGGMQRPGKCPVCGKKVMPRKDGITRAHYGKKGG